MNELINQSDKAGLLTFEFLHSLVKKTYSVIQIWRQNYRTRRQLKCVPKSLYGDLGLSSTEVKKESERPFWD